QNVKALMILINENNEDLENKFVSLKLMPIGMFSLLYYEGSFWKAAFYPGIFLILSTLLLISSLFSYLALLISNAESRWTEYRLRFSFGATGDTLRRIYAEVILVFMAIALGTCIVLELCYDSFFKYMQLPECPVMPWMAGVWTSILVVFLILCTIPVYLQNRKYKRAINGAPQGKPSSLNYSFVMCQVSVSVLLLFLVWNGSRQLHYVSVDALGMNPDRVYTFSFVREDEKTLVNTYEMAQEISALAVVDTCITLNPFFGGWGMAPPNSGVEHYQYHMTEAAIKLFEMKPNIWKPMTGEFTLNSNQALISSNVAEHYGVTPENPYVPYEDKEIIGTLDICTHDLHSDARLILFLPMLTNSWSKEDLYFRFLPGKEKEGIAAVEDLLRRRDINVDAGLVRVVNFGDLISDTYDKEQNYLTLYTILAIVGFGIAFFGLLTLVSADLQRQRRSLAIRRIFGATYGVCLRQTLRLYSIVTTLGTIIGLCIGFYLMTLWLETYSTTITLGWKQPLCIALAIALLVIALVAWKVRQCFREKPAMVIKA
ncbi:MAG: ABC transporter permease, partial [Bacteroidaceae bacterium]|nr:ABC transporter permease [Bacteroidaceae bacterium]